jgi:M6 family metalloprotease-like protein
MFDYWRDMSYGAISLTGSQVKGWYTMPQTLAQLNQLSRQDKIKACISAASAGFQDRTDFYAIAVMFNTPAVDSGAAGSATLTFNGITKTYPVLDLASSVWTSTFAAHEMGHAYGLDHSWSRLPDIEYGDPYDIMSALNVHSFVPSLPLFGQSGPGLTGVYRESLGWVPPARVFSTSLALGTAITVTLTPLDQPNGSGYLLAKIFAFGTTDRYYTVELRRATRWDRGFRQDTVLVHEVLSDGHSYLLTDGGAEHGVFEPFTDPVNHLSVVAFSLDANQATIQISRFQ